MSDKKIIINKKITYSTGAPNRLFSYKALQKTLKILSLYSLACYPVKNDEANTGN